MRFIEQPIGRSSFGRAKTWYTYALGAALAIPIIGTAALWRHNILTVVNEAVAASSLPASNHIAAIKLAALQTDAQDMSSAQLITAKMNVPVAYKDGCQQQADAPAAITCAYGQNNSPAKTIALVGSSHATQWLPAFQAIAASHALKIVLITKGGCTFGAVPGSSESCRQWNKNVIKKLAELRPDAVVTIATRPVPSSLRASSKSYPIEYVPLEFMEQWKLVEAMGIGIIGIRDNPWFDTDIATCVARHQDKPLNCSLPRKATLLPENPAIKIKQHFANLSLIDLTNYLCTDTICPVVSQNILMYRDQHHLSVPYVQSLTTALEQQIQQVRPDLLPVKYVGPTILAQTPKKLVIAPHRPMP